MHGVKGAWPDHFFDHSTYLNFSEILVPIDGSYFAHTHPEIWRSKIGSLQRNNKKRVNNKQSVVTTLNKTKNNIKASFSPTTSKQDTNL